MLSNLIDIDLFVLIQKILVKTLRLQNLVHMFPETKLYDCLVYFDSMFM